MRSAVRGAAPAVAAPSTSTQSSGRSTLLMLGMLAVALVLRLLFIGADGFKNDVASFEAWALALANGPTQDFYSKIGFADYPPGYFYVLWVVGNVYKHLVPADPNWYLIKVAVKLPGIVLDLVDAWLIFEIVKRYGQLWQAFAAAALLALNPAFVVISSYYGQVDSVPGALVLTSLLLVIKAYGERGRALTYSLVGAWLLVAASILMKPPGIIVAAVLVAFPFATSERDVMLERLRATAIGIGNSFVLAYLACIPFNHTIAPFELLRWLYGRYAYASSVYPYNSVNAFNLYALVHNFWQRDDQLLPNINGFGIPQYWWGIGLFVAAVLLVLSRFIQRRDPMAFVEAAMILSLGYFILLTRMHERYVFNAVMLAVPLAFFRRRYLIALAVLSITLIGNLYYSLQYQAAVGGAFGAVDATNLMPFLSRPMSFANVAVFFYLGYVYLGSGVDVLDGAAAPAFLRRIAVGARAWFSPREGIRAMAPLDWAIAGAMTVGSFVLSIVLVQWPSEKIFDEIYYARAAEEYIGHKEIFEFTHPPLTKLVVWLSTVMFGDVPFGWRFLNVVVGALMVLVMYCFAKRILGSTLFASLAAGFLMFDGFRYVQSRIATPEITVAFLSLLTIYAFYRYWIASQVRVAPMATPRVWRAVAIAFAVGVALSAGLTVLIVGDQTTAAKVVAFLYFAIASWTIARLAVPRFLRAAPIVSYAEGSSVSSGALVTFDGGKITEKYAPVPGDATRVDKGALAYADGGLGIEYKKDGGVVYRTTDGTASFAKDGTMQVDGAKIDGARDGTLWMWLFAISAAALAASKWNGLADLGVAWLFTALVVAQRLWMPALRALNLPNLKSKPAAWGNPSGFSLDIVVGATLMVAGAVYVMCYIPYFSLGHKFGDLVALQKQMYDYHHSLTATHPYGSKWWQWPIINRPIAYYYHDFRVGAATQIGSACCVAEVLALPNPVVWWFGLATVPFAGFLAWRERNKGYALLVVAYFLQWLPWILSPRVAFEYHFFPNDAIICMCDAIALQRIWRLAKDSSARFAWPKLTVWAYSALVVASFAFFYPILAGLHVSWNTWDARMLHLLMGNQWV